jgi:hypothetical protein
MDPPAVSTDMSQADRVAVGLLYLGVWIAWACVAAGIVFVRLYEWLDNLPPRTTERNSQHVTNDPTVALIDNIGPNRPRPLRRAAAIIGGLTALISGLVGTGLLTSGQGGALTGLISAAVSVLGSWGFVASTEGRVTPLTDPRDNLGNALTPDTTEAHQ